jgi:hypothetical protein
MKLAIVIFGLCGILGGQAGFAARPAAKTIAKKAIKAPVRAAARPAAKQVAARPPAGRPVARSAAAARPLAKAAPVRAVANRAPAQAALVPAKPVSGQASTVSAQDTAALSASIRSMSSAPTLGGGGMMRGPSSAHEIGEAMRVTGQSRNLSMGLLFSKDNDKIEFGNPRMHYKDKISSKQANY